LATSRPFTTSKHGHAAKEIIRFVSRRGQFLQHFSKQPHGCRIHHAFEEDNPPVGKSNHNATLEDGNHALADHNGLAIMHDAFHCCRPL